MIWWQDGERKIVSGWLTLSLFVVTVSSPAYSQSCALCYTQAAAATARFIEALRSGILLLIVPPMFLYGGLTRDGLQTAIPLQERRRGAKRRLVIAVAPQSTALALPGPASPASRNLRDWRLSSDGAALVIATTLFAALALN